jgi:hypothetical protein
VKKRQSLLWKENQVVANTESKPLPIQPQSATWIPGPRTLLRDTTDITWELLINNILKSISDLNYSAKNDIKALYIQQASQIVRAIRDMLACSGTISTESEMIKQNRSLAAYHQNIMTSLSKIILAAKVASGLWPPPDAVHSMRFQAGQVLLAVRHFVAVAQDLGIQLRSLPESPQDDFDIKGTELSDSELVSRLDQNCEIIMNSIASLVTKITRDRQLSTTLIDHVRKTITEIGQFMSLIEDIKFDPSMDADNLVGEFKQKKETLYTVVNDLVSASSAGEDGFAPSNALGMMLESATSVLESVEDVLVASKLLIDHKELILQKSLYNQTETINEDSELVNLQKKAKSLTFLETRNGTAEPNSARISSGSQPWNRDSRTISTDSQQYGRKNSISQQSFKRMSQDLASPPPDSASSSKLNQFFGEHELPSSSRLSDVCIFDVAKYETLVFTQRTNLRAFIQYGRCS